MGFGARCRVDGRRYPRLVLDRIRRKFPHVSDGLIRYIPIFIFSFLFFGYTTLSLLELRPERVLPPVSDVPPGYDPSSCWIKPSPRLASRVTHPLFFSVPLLVVVVGPGTGKVPQFLDILLEQVCAQPCVVLRYSMRAVRVVREA
jgi:hypothetical protein